ncbi:MAG TPA: ABC transporter permease [Mucilaginibacter sp.]
MDKILLIIKREYITRVRKRLFIVMIFLLPLLILAMGVIIGLIAKSSNQIDHQNTVAVIDKSGVFAGKFHNIPNLKFEETTGSLTDLKARAKKDESVSALVIPVNFAKKDSVQFYSKNKPSNVVTGEIERQMNDIAIADGMLKHHIDTAVLHSIKSDISLNTVEITDLGEQKTNLGAMIGVGIACSILIYMSVLIYGSQVMRGVIEEKNSRIVEVIISSVKPYQLMMGKVIGVGLVGLTQYTAWVVLSYLAIKVAGVTTHGPQSGMLGALATLQTIPVGPVMGVFFFYFLSGYLLYSALFAAVGSAVDSETETQQFMFPITMPLLFTYILSVSILFQAPNGSLAVWLSMIPLTAPVAMVLRMPFGVPDWQLAISMSLMVLTFLFAIYVAARIYRVGILMYGKKASYKELVKWFFYKE